MLDDATLPEAPPSKRWVRTIFLGALSIGLVWLIVSRSLVAYLSQTAPGLVSRLGLESSSALIGMADVELYPLLERQSKLLRRQPVAGSEATHVQVAGEGEIEGARAAAMPLSLSAAEIESLQRIASRARQALTDAPLSASAVRILGEVAQLQGETAVSRRLMSFSVNRWRHETAAIFRMMIESVEDKNFVAGLEYAEAMMRTRPELKAFINPVLLRIADDPTAAGMLVERLARNPQWRRFFTHEALQGPSDGRGILKILVALRSTPNPPDELEISNFLQTLLTMGQYEAAYYSWLQLLPTAQLAKAGLLFNGNFEYVPAGMPFDWTLRNDIGARVEIVPHDEAGFERAMRVELGPERVQALNVFQWLVLSPGTYQLNGKYRGTVNGRRGLRWRMFCIDSHQSMVAETPMFVGLQRDWRDFQVAFEIPSTGCRAQQLRLILDARYSSEQFATGVGWYDKLAISRLSVK